MRMRYILLGFATVMLVSGILKLKAGNIMGANIHGALVVFSSLLAVAEIASDMEDEPA